MDSVVPPGGSVLFPPKRAGVIFAFLRTQVGVLLVFGMLLWRYRRLIMPPEYRGNEALMVANWHRQRDLKPLMFIVHHYRPTCCCYSLAEMVRRIACTSVLLFMQGNLRFAFPIVITRDDNAAAFFGGGVMKDGCARAKITHIHTHTHLPYSTSSSPAIS